MKRPFQGPRSDTLVFSGCHLFCSCRMRRRTKNVFHLMSVRKGVKERSAGRMARRPGRVGRSRRSSFLCRLERRPPVLPQSGRAAATPREGACRVDGVARARVSRMILFEDRQHPARAVSRVARDLAEFAPAQLDLV
jgi:hypothetical protein